MTMKRVLISTLKGRALDYAVCRSLSSVTHYDSLYVDCTDSVRYSDSWALTGPLIDDFKIAFSVSDGGNIGASMIYDRFPHTGTGSNHLEAACRVIVATLSCSYAVNIPERLL